MNNQLFHITNHWH